jgi:hypothetical protein
VERLFGRFTISELRVTISLVGFFLSESGFTEFKDWQDKTIMVNREYFTTTKNPGVPTLQMFLSQIGTP